MLYLCEKHYWEHVRDAHHGHGEELPGSGKTGAN